MFLGAYPDLPGDTIARLVAVHVGPRGAERALVEDAEVDSLLAELAPLVPQEQRPFRFERRDDGSWTAGFLGALLQRSPTDRGWRISVARWRVIFDSAHAMAWQRTELLSDAVLERYRV